MDAVRRILLVENDGILIVTISQALRQSGYEVMQAVSNGEDAIAMVERDPPDLVLMDIGLNGPNVHMCIQLHVSSPTRFLRPYMKTFAMNSVSPWLIGP